jgi:phage terminase large subunit GpA-like protein
MESFTSPAVRETVLCIASQVGKTELANNAIGYFIHADPSPMLIKYPTIDAGKGWSKEKLDPMIQDTPVLRGLIQESRTRDSGNTILQKTFPGGFLRVAGANSPSGLRRASCRVVIQDEIDSDPPSAGTEGDPCALADRRTSNFGNAVKIKMSTPTIKGESKIWALLEDSDYRTWRAICPHCAKPQELTWSAVKWEKDAEGKSMPETAHYLCVDGCRWGDLDRQRAIMRGHWAARQPFKGRRGYHVSGLYKLMGQKPQFVSMLHEFVVEFLEAKRGGPETMKSWTNTFLAEPWEETFEKLDESAIVARAEDYKPDEVLPAGVLRIDGAADVQGDRIEAELIGFGENEETWGLGYVVLHGDTSRDAVWEELDKFIVTQFKHPSGKAMGATSFFVDSGDKQDRVFQFTAPRRSRGVFASKGYNSPGKQIPILPRKPSLNNKRKVPQWIVGVTAAKTVWYDRVMLPVPGARSMHYPKGYGYDERYFRQLTTEKRRLRYAHGKPYYIYEAKAGQRNEPLDIRVYALAAHRRVQFNPAQLKLDLGVKGEAATASQPEVDRQPSDLPRAGNMQLERAPIETPAQQPAKPVAASPLSSVKLPAYVPMHLRKK